jgi:hypothetical protein
MLRQRKPNALSLSYFSCVVLLICSGLHAQENCNVEVKLLLSPAETQAAVAALSAKKKRPVASTFSIPVRSICYLKVQSCGCVRAQKMI